MRGGGKCVRVWGGRSGGGFRCGRRIGAKCLGTISCPSSTATCTKAGGGVRVRGEREVWSGESVGVGWGGKVWFPLRQLQRGKVP